MLKFLKLIIKQISKNRLFWKDICEFRTTSPKNNNLKKIEKQEKKNGWYKCESERFFFNPCQTILKRLKNRPSLKNTVV